MMQLMRIYVRLLVIALAVLILGCEVLGSEENNKKIEAVLLLDFINYGGKITYGPDDDQESYSTYASGFYSSLISGTMINANSDTIAGRYIMISFNSQTAGNYAGSGNSDDKASIIIADGYDFTWASNRSGGSAAIAITKYGRLGDTIEGEFSGTLKHKCDCTTLKIENGKFMVRRTADQ